MPQALSLPPVPQSSNCLALQGGKDRPGIFASLLRYRDPSVEPSKEVKAAKDSGLAETGLLPKAENEDTRPRMSVLKHEDAQKRSWLNRISGAYSAAGAILSLSLARLLSEAPKGDCLPQLLQLGKQQET